MGDNNDTTVTGVSEGEIDQLNAGKPQSPREAMLAEIAKNAKKARAMEEEGAIDVLGERNRIAAGDDEPDAGKKTDDPPPEDPPVTEEKVLVKINGVERLAPKAEVDAEGGIVAYQKARSADEKFRQAAILSKQNEERERALAQRELAISQKEQALSKEGKDSVAKPSTPDAPRVSEDAKRIKDKMYSGDEEQTAEAIQAILDASKGNATQLDPQKVAAEASVLAAREVERQLAVNEFKTKYKAIEENPEYRKYAGQITLQLFKDHPDWGPRQIIMEAGEQAMLKYGDEIREKAAKTEDDERINRKRATDNVTGADAKVTPKPAPKPKTPSEIVAALQSGRSHQQQ